MTLTLITDRKNLRETRWAESEPMALPDGGVRLRIDLFALTSNNVTYAAFGESMHYWDFFPAGDAASGCMPVWGFGTVVESRCDGVAMGKRFYGFLPLADEVVLTPTRVGSAGFVDGAGHRRELPAVYNHYVRCSADPLHDPEREAEQALLRPLFATSFLIDDFLADNGFFGARRVVLSSASSKTAYGTAFCLAERRGSGEGVEVVGLTSAGHAPFTGSLGCYDRVVRYDELASLPADVASVYVDMSGDAALRAAVHEHLGPALTYSCAVGGTHWQALGSGSGLPGPRPVLFFAPAQIRKRNAEWGREVHAERVAAAWHRFLDRLADPKAPWLRVVRGKGPAAVESTYRRLLDGAIPAAEGHVLSL